MPTISGSKPYLLLAGAVLLQCTACASVPTEPSALAASEITIVSTEFKYHPNIVEVVAGQPVTLVLDNTQAATEHGIAVPALNFRLFARAGQVSRAIFVFPVPGRYAIVCDLPGHTEAGMKGTVIVASTASSHRRKTVLYETPYGGALQ